MSNTVVFLGAGASKALGLPITKEIFPKLLERLITKPAGVPPLFRDDPVDQERLKRCLYAILPGLSDLADAQESRDAWIDSLPLITDVLSAVDYSLVTANAPDPDFTLSELAQARTLLERAIFELLVRNEDFDSLHMKDVPEAVRVEWQQTAERQFLEERAQDHDGERRRTVDWLRKLGSRSKDRVTLISTNYDVEIEQELYTRLGYSDVFRCVDFGTSIRDPAAGVVYPRPNNASFGVYKLHGSLNWLRCDLCDNIYVNPVGAIAYLSFFLGEEIQRQKRDDPWLERLEASGANKCHCGYRPLRHVIVAPSFVRAVRDVILLGIWRNALEALRQADEWIIIGYSIPPEDVAIRSMLLRAYRGRDTGQRPHVTVVQQEKKEPELSRYRLLFPNHQYVAGGFAGYLDSNKVNPAT